MKQYLNLMIDILNNGAHKTDRTGTGTLSVFGRQLRFDLSEGFPLVTTKKIHFRSIIYELLWFLNGDTNIKYLKDNGVSIWDEWADANGELGPVYGHQWRSWPAADGKHIDQITQVLNQIKTKPDSRRHMVTAWNPSEVDKMALPPCHALFQFYVADGKLSCQLYQRSCDTFLGLPAYALLTYWLRVTAWLARLPGAATTLDGYTTPYAIATYAAVTALAIWIRRAMALGGLTRFAPPRPMHWRAAARPALYLAPAALLAVSAGWLASGSSQARRLEVTVLDVGQGDAILIETPGGRDVLIDSGPGRAVLRGLGREMAWRDRSIDLVVVTHAQADHATGLLDVLDRYDVRRIVAGPSGDNSLIERTLTRAASGEGAAIERLAAGTSFDLGGGVRLDVLSPPAAADGASGNDASIVLRLVWRDVSFLLTGDIEANAEKALVESGVDLRATVLKVAHHGSKTSSTTAFLDAVRPSIAVVSSGAENRFGHPAPDVIERLGAYADIYNTAADGAVHFETDGQRLWIETER